MQLEKILKFAEIESDWLRYYGFREDRLTEKFEDYKFYERITFTLDLNLLNPFEKIKNLKF